MKKKYEKYENLDEDTKMYISKKRKKRVYISIALCFFAVAMMFSWEYIYFITGLHGELDRYQLDMEDMNRRTEYNPQREILDRMYSEDSRDINIGVKKANEECEISYNMEFNDYYKVKLQVKQYNYGKIYKTSLKEANGIIKEKKEKDRLKKNEIFSECLRENFKRAEEKGEKKTYILHRYAYDDRHGSIYNEMFHLFPDDDYDDKYDIYDAFLGEIRMAMEENPCDYLLLKNEYKIYDDLTESIIGYIDKFRNDKKYKKYNDIINEFDDVDMGFDKLKEWLTKELLTIDCDIVDGESQIANVNIISFDYGSSYKFAMHFADNDISLKEERLGRKLTDKEKEKLFFKEFKSAVKGSSVGEDIENLSYSYKKDKYGYNKYYITPSEEQEEKLYNAFVGGLVEAMN